MADGKLPHYEEAWSKEPRRPHSFEPNCSAHAGYHESQKWGALGTGNAKPTYGNGDDNARRTTYES